MAYSITPILHNRVDKKGLQKIQILVIHKRIKIIAETIYRVRKDQWASFVINHANANKINGHLKEKVESIERRVIDVLNAEGSKEQLIEAVKKGPMIKLTPLVYDYIKEDIMVKFAGKFSNGSIRHYSAIANRINEFAPGVKFSDISIQWLKSFENYLRNPHMVSNRYKPEIKKETVLDVNTINTNMKKVKAIMSKAAADGYISEEAYKNYKSPRYQQKLAEYLSEEEIASFHKVCDATEHAGMKLSGYYFLLACYSGYRFSDAKRFDSEVMTKGDKIILRAQKNKQIVSIKIHSRLIPILAFIKEKPLTINDQDVRDYIKKICFSAGIKKKVTFHTARHSFAMLLMEKGFTIDEVAELIGDTPMIAKVYARIHNDHLNKKIMDKLG